MELRHLRYFTAVAAHGSFNRAAKVLHLTQPALSRQVKDLEEEIGVPLLKRGSNAVRLTEAGEIFYEEARELIARAEQAIQRVRGNAQKEILRVGYAPSLVVGVMPIALERFQAQHPQVQVELADLSARELIEEATAGSLHMVIAPQQKIPGFQWTEFRRVNVVLVMARKHPLARLKKIPPERVRDLALIGLGRENFPDYALYVRSRLQPFGVVPRFVTWVNDGISSLFAAVEANHAAAFLADGAASMMPRTLVARPLSPGIAPVAVHVGLPDLRPNPHAESFARFVREAERRLRT